MIQPSTDLNRPVSATRRDPTYLDPTDRPLSGGELFALFMLGLVFVLCGGLVLVVGVMRGEITL